MREDFVFGITTQFPQSKNTLDNLSEFYCGVFLFSRYFTHKLLKQPLVALKLPRACYLIKYNHKLLK